MDRPAPRLVEMTIRRDLVGATPGARGAEFLPVQNADRQPAEKAALAAAARTLIEDGTTLATVAGGRDVAVSPPRREM